MSINKFKVLIILAALYDIGYFAFLRIYSIPLEEYTLLGIIIFWLLILAIAVGIIWDARKSNKKDK